MAKCSGRQLRVYIFHGDQRPQTREDLLEAIGDASVVLTTYDMLKPVNTRPTALKSLHWWRVVLDESQMVPKPPSDKAALSTLSVIGRQPGPEPCPLEACSPLCVSSPLLSQGQRSPQGDRREIDTSTPLTRPAIDSP